MPKTRRALCQQPMLKCFRNKRLFELLSSFLSKFDVSKDKEINVLCGSLSVFF